MKNILILSENKKWKMEIADLFGKGKEEYPIQWAFVSTRGDIISELSMRTYDAVVLNSGLPISNLQIIFKYLASTDYKKLPIFFISKNFSEFEELIAQQEFSHIQLIAAPIENELITKNIQTVLYPTQTEGPVDKQVKINLEFLKIFVDATKFILQSFCNLKTVDHSRPYLYKYDTANELGIEGKIYLKSTLFEGEFIIGFSKVAYLSILKIVLSQEDEEITKDNEDFAGEIVNMVYGQAKTVLNLSGHNFEKVLPTFMSNPPKYQSKNPIVVVPLETEAGRIELLVHVINIKKSA